MEIPVGNVNDDWWSTFIAFIGACVNVAYEGKFQNIPIPVMSYAVSVGKIVKKNPHLTQLFLRAHLSERI